MIATRDNLLGARPAPVDADAYLSLGQASRLVPGWPNRSTIRRWIFRGICIEGRRVRLAACRVGARLLVKRTDLAAFLSACGGPAPVPAAVHELGPGTLPARSAIARKTGPADTRAYLTAVGLLGKDRTRNFPLEGLAPGIAGPVVGPGRAPANVGSAPGPHFLPR